MRTNRRRVPLLFAGVGLVLAALVVFTAISADSGEKTEVSADALFAMPVEGPFTPAARPGPRCCDPDLEPGTGGNPFCFEGASCCADGRWQCNNPDGTPSCALGEVCPAGCAGRNESCEVDEDCCSGDCKRNGRCR